MSKIIKAIGCIVFSLAMYAVPILLTCAFAFDWNGLVKTALSGFATAQIFWIFSLIDDAVNREDGK